MNFVQKRDGRIEEFQLSKVKKALLMAFNELNEPSSEVDYIAQNVFNNLDFNIPVSVESIQDQIERCLMAYDYFDIARAYIRYRDRKSECREVHPDPDSISTYIHYAKYSRFVPYKNRRESYKETITRVLMFHQAMYPTLVQQHKDLDIPINYIPTPSDLEKAFSFVYSKHVLPSMRSLQFAGPALKDHQARMYNCSATHLNSLTKFSQIFYLLLCGCGVGISVEWENVRQIPQLGYISKSKIQHNIIADTIEGWCSALETLLYSYIPLTDSSQQSTCPYVEFSYHNIRPEGAPLISSGGKAPGHLCLKEMLEAVRARLNIAQGRRLRPIECYDICCLIAKAVLSGGVRRSSLITLFSEVDTEMLYAKTGNWYIDNPQRAMSNNSAVITDRRVFDTIIELSQEWGEPGFFFRHGDNGLCNPCGEIYLTPGKDDFGFCNLVEVDFSKVTKDNFKSILEAATLIACYQAAYINIYDHYNRPLYSSKDRLIGVSLTGILDNPLYLAHTTDTLSDCHTATATATLSNCHTATDTLPTDTLPILNFGRKIVQHIAKKYGCDSGRCTCVKPSGTASLALGNVSNGIHPHYAKRYFRRVTANRMDPVAKYFAKYNPHCIEDTGHPTDIYIVFPVEAPQDAKLTLDLSTILFVRDNWITIPNNISCSYTLQSSQDADTIFNSNLTIALVPPFLDKKYPNAPKESVSTRLDELRWQELIRLYTPPDWSAYTEESDTTDFRNIPSCEGPKCDLA